MRPAEPALPSSMLTHSTRAVSLFVVALTVCTAVFVGVSGAQPSSATTHHATLPLLQTQEQPRNGTGTPQQRPISASTTRTGSSSFRIEVRNANFGDSASVEPPNGVGTAGYNTDLRSVRLTSRGRDPSFAVDVDLNRRLDGLSNPDAATGPSDFDTQLLYAQVDAETEAVDIRYTFDIETDFLQERNARDDGIEVRVYRDGTWSDVSARTQYSGNETIVRASVRGSGLIAVGLQHPNISVERIEPADPPVVVNRTEPLSLTVENSGSRDGQRSFVITAENRPVANTTVSVPAGEQRTVTVPVTFPRAIEVDLEAGEYATELRVVEPVPNISVQEYSLSRTQIQTGDTIQLTATVQNTGTGSGTDLVEFRAFDETVATRQVTLRPGERTTLKFSQTFESPGTYQVGVDNQTTAVTVRSGPDWRASPTESVVTVTNSSDSPSDGQFQWALVVLGGGLAVLLSVVMLGRLFTE